MHDEAEAFKSLSGSDARSQVKLFESLFGIAA